MRLTKIQRIKANRKGSRDAELELNKGFNKLHKIFINKKKYNRKIKWET